MTPEQITFVQSQLAGGATAEQVTQLLLAHSYTTQQINALLVAAAGGVPPVTTVVQRGERLPSVGTFFTLVRQRLAGRMHLLALLAAYSVTLEALLYGAEHYVDKSLGLAIAVVVLGVCSIPVSIVVSAMVLRNLLHSAPRALGEDYTWALHNMGSFLWVGVLVGCVLIPSFLFFFIPGIVVCGYVALSQSVRIMEDVRGINALVRSTELVRGVWWSSFLRVLVVMVPTVIVVGLAGGILNILVGKTSFLGTLMQTLVQTISGYVMLVVIVEMYLHLSAGQPAFDSAKPTGLRTLYCIMAWAGPVCIVGLIVLAVMAIGTIAMHAPAAPMR